EPVASEGQAGKCGRPRERSFEPPRREADDESGGERKGQRVCRATMAPRRFVVNAQRESDDVGIGQDRERRPRSRNRPPGLSSVVAGAGRGQADGDVSNSGHQEIESVMTVSPAVCKMNGCVNGADFLTNGSRAPRGGWPSGPR